MNRIRKYIRDVQVAMDHLSDQEIDEVIQVLFGARLENRQVFIMGNGGSASTASHLVCDLAKNTRVEGMPHFRVIGLTDNLALFSALANDDGYQNVFSGQLAGLVMPHDIVIGISTSGNSANVVNALELANRIGAVTVGLTGFDGGAVRSIVDYNIQVHSPCIEVVEDVHLVLGHLICHTLRSAFRQHQKALSAGRPAADDGFFLKSEE